MDPTTIDIIKMSCMFEDPIRRFSENGVAGDHYPPRSHRHKHRLAAGSGCENLFDDQKVVTVLVQAAGAGGMLFTTYSFLRSSILPQTSNCMTGD